MVSRRLTLLFLLLQTARAWVSHSPAVMMTRHLSCGFTRTAIFSANSDEATQQQSVDFDHDTPEDAVISIKPAAMKRLIELRKQQKLADDVPLVLRMGVRSGGCSGMSYVMDFSNVDSILEDDFVDEYPEEKIQCVVDAKSLLFLYGLELDYSEELIGGGFKFFNPNAEESCGCGSSFGV